MDTKRKEKISEFFSGAMFVLGFLVLPSLLTQECLFMHRSKMHEDAGRGYAWGSEEQNDAPACMSDRIHD